MSREAIPTWEEWELSIFDDVDRFVVLLIEGGGKRTRREYRDLAVACKRAEGLVGAYGRTAIVRCLARSGRSIVLDRKDWPRWLARWRMGKQRRRRGGCRLIGSSS